MEKPRKTKYKIFAPKVRSDLRKKEREIGRKLNKEEKREFIIQDIQRLRGLSGKVIIFSALVASGIAGITAMGTNKTKLLEAPKESKVISTEEALADKDEKLKTNNNEFKESLQVDFDQNSVYIDENNNNDIVQEIIGRYNNNLSEADIGYIKTNPQFVTIDENGNYVYDYKEKTNASEYITDKNQIGDIYTVIDRTNDKIISSVGMIDNKIVNINSKQVLLGDKEYLQSDNMIDLTKNENQEEKNEEELSKVYDNLKDNYEKVLEDQERE